MADVNKNVIIDRDYSDNFSIKDMALNKIGPKYFSEVDLSALNVGALGFTMEQIANITEDSFNTSSLLMNEAFPQHAKIPENIHSHAALFQLNNTFTPCAKCSFIMMIEQEDVIKHGTQSKGLGNSNTYTMYIDKRSTFSVEGIPFTLDYDIIVTANSVQNDPNIVDNYNFSAKYDMEQGKNCVSEIVDPYLKIRKTANGYLIIQFTAHQVERTEISDTIISNTKINYPVLNYSFDGELAGFDIFYKAPTDKSWRQLDKALKFSLPLTTDFCYYTLTDENELEISFSTKDKYFQPAFNSEIRIVLYTTMGKKGNFESYNGNNVTVETNSETYEYNGKITIAVKPMSDSSGGADKLGLDALQALSVEGYSTANEISTETDIMQYFYNYKYRYGTEILVIKRRDDVTERLFSAFLIIKRDNYIFPTNTVHMNLKNEDFDSHDDDFGKTTLDAGHTFIYDDDTYTDADNGDIYRLVNGKYSRFDAMTHLLESNIVPISFLRFTDPQGNVYEFGKTANESGIYPIYVTYRTDSSGVKKEITYNEFYSRMTVDNNTYRVLPNTMMDKYGNTYMKMNGVYFERYPIKYDKDGKAILTKDDPSVYTIQNRDAIIPEDNLPDIIRLETNQSEYARDVVYTTQENIYFSCRDIVYLSSASTNGYHLFDEIVGYIEEYNGVETVFVPSGSDTFLAYQNGEFIEVNSTMDNPVPSTDIHTKTKVNIIQRAYYNNGTLFVLNPESDKYLYYKDARNIDGDGIRLSPSESDMYYYISIADEYTLPTQLITFEDDEFNTYHIASHTTDLVYKQPPYGELANTSVSVSLDELFIASHIYRTENMNTVKPLSDEILLAKSDFIIGDGVLLPYVDVKAGYYFAKFTDYSYITMRDEEYYVLYNDKSVVVDGADKLSKSYLYDISADTTSPKFTDNELVVTTKPIMVWEKTRLAESFKSYDFIYTLPFITSVTREPNLAGLYQTVCDSTHSLTWASDNVESFTSFITSQINLKRSLDNTKDYKLSLSLVPSSSMEQYVMNDTINKNTYKSLGYKDSNNTVIKKISDSEYVAENSDDRFLRSDLLILSLTEFLRYVNDESLYEQYERDYEVYKQEKEAYEEYTVALKIYNEALAKYNQYLTDYAKYESDLNAYNEYLAGKARYEQDYDNWNANDGDPDTEPKAEDYYTEVDNPIEPEVVLQPTAPEVVTEPVEPEEVAKPENPSYEYGLVLNELTVSEAQAIIDNNALNANIDDKVFYKITGNGEIDMSWSDSNIRPEITTFLNDVRVIVGLSSNSKELCYVELLPEAINPSDPTNVTFSARITSDDHVTSTSTFKLSNIVNAEVSVDIDGNVSRDYEATLPLSDVTATVYILYNFQNDDAEENMFIKHFDDMGEYVIVNTYVTEHDTLEFIKPMNLMRCAVTFDNYGDNINPIVNSKVQLLPMVKADTITDDESFNIFINRLTSNYEYMETCLPKLRNNTNIDIKFYNTYGKSINYIIENEGSNEPELIDRVNISIRFNITAVDGIDETELKLNLKAYIKDFIESVNSSGNNSLYISNLIRGIENNFGSVHHLKFGGINDYDTGYQTIRVKEPNLSNLTKLERREYVPEILVIDDDDINLSVTVN